MPYVVPDVLDAPGQPVSTASFWGDSAVVLPWEIYMASGSQICQGGGGLCGSA